MLWNFLATILALLSRPFQSDVSSPVGPQSVEEIREAHEAFYGSDREMILNPNYAGKKDNSTRWPGFPGKATVPYVISKDLVNITKLIDEAIEQYHKNTCIKFVKRTNERTYLNIIKDTGCYSYVGQYVGPQPVSLGKGCWFVGTIVHELGHAIGLYHEHQRSDRDTYITVYDANIKTGLQDQFNKTDPADELILTKYDYTSIMHYGNYAFSKDPGNLMTMVAKNKVPLLEPYQKKGLNKVDIEQIKKLYKCP